MPPDPNSTPEPICLDMGTVEIKATPRLRAVLTLARPRARPPRRRNPRATRPRSTRRRAPRVTRAGPGDDDPDPGSDEDADGGDVLDHITANLAARGLDPHERLLAFHDELPEFVQRIAWRARRARIDRERWGTP